MQKSLRAAALVLVLASSSATMFADAQTGGAPTPHRGVPPTPTISIALSVLASLVGL